MYKIRDDFVCQDFLITHALLSTDMVCSCQYSADNVFYRALITNLPGRKLVDVLYVDFGNRERVHYSRLRVLLDEFLILPAQVR